MESQGCSPSVKMTESHIASDGSIESSVATIRTWTQVLSPRDVETLRTTCTWTTSLTVRDVQRLEALVAFEELREHIKTLRIDDNVEENSEVTDGTSRGFWPRDAQDRIITEELGLAQLKHMFLEKRLRLDTIEVIYRSTTSGFSDPETAGDFACDIVEGADLAIRSIAIGGDTADTTVITLRLSPQCQGQGVGMSLLHLAKLEVNHDFSSHWCTQALYHAPALKHLELRFAGPRGHHPSRQLVAQGRELPSLQRLKIRSAELSMETIMAIIANSKHSLTEISLSVVRLITGSWHELLSQIADEFLALSSFEIGGLIQGPIQETRYVRFRGLSMDCIHERYRTGLELKTPRRKKEATGVLYHEHGVRDVLEMIAVYIVVEETAERVSPSTRYE